MAITGRKFELYVTHAEKSVNQWLSVWGHEDQNYLSSLQELITSLTPDFKATTLHEIRQAYNCHDIVCISLSSEKDVRAKIFRMEEASNTASVYLIDFGKIRTVELQNIKIIPDNPKGQKLRVMEVKLKDYILGNILPKASKWNDANLYLMKRRLESGGIPVECFSTNKYPRLLRAELNDSLLRELAEDEVIQIIQPQNINDWLASFDPSGVDEIVRALEAIAIEPPIDAPAVEITPTRKRFLRCEDDALLKYVLEHCQHPRDANSQKLFEEASRQVEALSQRSGSSLYGRFTRYIRPKIDEYTDDGNIINLWKPQ